MDSFSEKEKKVKKYKAGAVIILILAIMVVGVLNEKAIAWRQQQFSAPAVPIETADAEESFTYGFTVNTPIKVEIIPSPPNPPGENNITIAFAVKNASAQTEEVIYYFDYLSTPTPAFVEKVVVNSVEYNWGQKIPIAAGSEQRIVISLRPEPWVKNSDISLKFRVIRWLGPRG